MENLWHIDILYMLSSSILFLTEVFFCKVGWEWNHILTQMMQFLESHCKWDFCVLWLLLLQSWPHFIENYFQGLECHYLRLYLDGFGWWLNYFLCWLIGFVKFVLLYTYSRWPVLEGQTGGYGAVLVTTWGWWTNEHFVELFWHLQMIRTWLTLVLLIGITEDQRWLPIFLFTF